MDIIKKSLLNFLRREHFDELIKFENTIVNREQNIEIHYAVDADDIKKFCFPFGLDFENNKDTEPQLIAQSQLAYQSIFYHRENKPIILDEYIPELRNLRKKAGTLLNSEKEFAKKFRDDFENLSESIKKDISSKEIKDFIKKNCTELFTLATNSSGLGIKRFKELISERVILDLDDFQKDDDKDGTILSEAFERVKKSNLTNKVYDYFAKQLTYDDNINDVHDVLVSKYYDASAIDRLISVNSYLYEQFVKQRTKKRHIILYLSSTSLSNRLFYEQNILNDFNPLTDNQIQLYNIKLNLLRNKDQVFAKHIYKDTTPGYASVKLNILKQLFLKKEKINENKGNSTTELIKKTIQDINDERDSLINVNLFKQFSNYHQVLENILVNDDIKSDTSLLQNLADIIERCKEQANDKDWVELETSLSINTLKVDISFLNNMLNDELKAIFSIKDPVFLKSPKDHVASSFQHLPILFNFKKESLQTIIDKFIISFIEKQNTRYIDIVKNLFLEPNTLDAKLIKGLLVILLPESFSDDNNKLVAEWIEDIIIKEIIALEINDRSYNDIKQGEEFIILIEKKEEIKQKLTEINKLLFREYLYFSCWVSRRCGSFKVAKELAEFGCELYADDPRFNHGLSLACYCLFADDKTQVSILKKSIREAERAIEKFSNNCDLNDNRKTIIDKIICSLYNSISYYYAALYNIEKSNNYIDKSRENLDLLKKNEINYHDFPEYLHTECFLEIQEYHILKSIYDLQSSKDLEDKITQKIGFALEAIKTAISILERNDDKKDATRSITTRISKYNDLQREIFKIISDNVILSRTLSNRMFGQ